MYSVGHALLVPCGYKATYAGFSLSEAKQAVVEIVHRVMRPESAVVFPFLKKVINRRRVERIGQIGVSQTTSFEVGILSAFDAYRETATAFDKVATHGKGIHVDGIIAVCRNFIVVRYHTVGAMEWQTVEARLPLVARVVAMEPIGGTDHAALRITAHEVGKGSQVVRRPFVVGIKKSYPFAAALSHAPVAGNGYSAVRLSDEADTPVRNSGDLFWTIVGTSVVDHNDFKIVVCLRQHTVQAASHKVPCSKGE